VFDSLHSVSATRLAIAFAFVAGLAGAAQAAIAGALGRRVGSVQAAAFGTVVAATILVLLAFALGRGGGIIDALHQPAWLWSIGLLGATIVLAITFAPPLIGTFATVALLIAGQLIAGVLIDAYGLLGSPRLPVTWARASGLVLVAVGAALTLKR
jgi:bacterial/archaeal transporter family-2 protein